MTCDACGRPATKLVASKNVWFTYDGRMVLLTGNSAYGSALLARERCDKCADDLIAELLVCGARWAVQPLAVAGSSASGAERSSSGAQPFATTLT